MSSVKIHSVKILSRSPQEWSRIRHEFKHFIKQFIKTTQICLHLNSSYVGEKSFDRIYIYSIKEFSIIKDKSSFKQFEKKKYFVLVRKWNIINTTMNDTLCYINKRKVTISFSVLLIDTVIDSFWYIPFFCFFKSQNANSHMFKCLTRLINENVDICESLFIL